MISVTGDGRHRLPRSLGNRQDHRSTGRQTEQRPDPAVMNLGLTIDVDLQMVADSLFGDTLSGAAVFLDPKTGEILALVSKPNL